MSIKSPMSVSSFWQSIDILITKFNVINKRLWGCKTLFRRICMVKNIDWHTPAYCPKLDEQENIENYMESIFNELKLAKCSEPITTNGIEVVVIEMLPKQYTEKKAFQLIILEKLEARASFYDVTPESYNQKLCPVFYYSIKLQNDTILLNVKDTELNSKSYKWLLDTVLPQFIKWGTNDNKNNTFCNDSLALISTEKYYKKYNELKLKYGKDMVEVWPEGTDPAKFVYEDVAIATYLLLLWEDEDDAPRKKTFVDLGCGNGLLVYILTKEGHQGVGIDVRKRQIWDMYPDDVQLKIKTIIPSDINLFPEADWLIGNHSDELTPWIPVIAARSSYKCRFFLLPCCAFNFDGTKYQRKDSSKSQYTEYLEHIKGICEECGFVTRIDRLKIPSTKRICLVGQKRVHSKQDYEQYCDRINYLINNSTTLTPDSETKTKSTTSWTSNFKPRESIERVRNCTQIDKNVTETIVGCVSKYLLEGCNSETEWSCGKLVDISELISLLSEKQLKIMKAECGGLQTLLKNNHHIFKVQSGKVQLRYPKTIEEIDKKSRKKDKNNKSSIKLKQKPCWFHINHPQGCPLSDKICSYRHES